MRVAAHTEKDEQRTTFLDVAPAEDGPVLSRRHLKSCSPLSGRLCIAIFGSGFSDRAVQWRLLLFCVVFCSAAWATSFAPREADYTLRRISVKDGTVEWAWALPPECRAYRLELHGSRLALFYHRPLPVQPDALHADPVDATRVVFLDVKSGQLAEPFDSRHFLHASENRAIASSPALPMLDNSQELYLPGKRWISFGNGRRGWDGTTKLHFFDLSPSKSERSVAWTIDLPGVFHLQHHGDTLIFSRSTRTSGVSENEIAAIAAGEDKARWTFRLPADVPTLTYPALPPGTPQPSRYIRFAVSGPNVVAYGNGHVFALDPATGAVRWRYNIAANPALAATWEHFRFATPVRSRDLDCALLFTGPFHPADQTLLRVDSDGKARILTRELCDGDMTLLAADGAVFHLKATDKPERLRSEKPL